MIYTDFGSILAPKENNIQMNIRKQYTDKPYTSKYQKDVACSYDCNLTCVEYTFSRLLKSYLGEDAVS